MRAAIAQAERIAHVTLEEVFVSVCCGRLQSLKICRPVDIDGSIVRADDIDRLMAGGHAFAEREGPDADTSQPHRLPCRRRLGSHDPRGMAARASRPTCTRSPPTRRRSAT